MKFITIFAYLFSLCVGYNILIPIPHTYRSVSSLMHSLVMKLVNSGHRVTFITPYAAKGYNDNLTLIVLDKKSQIKLDGWEVKTNAVLMDRTRKNVLIASEVFCQDKRVQELWRKRNMFDMVITSPYFNEIAFIFLHEFKGVAAEFCMGGQDYECLNKLGNKVSPSIISSVMDSLFNTNLNFFERIENIHSQYVIQGYINPAVAQPIADKYFPELGNIMRYHDVIDLTLINSHFTLDFPLPLLPNQVEIGCIDCDTRNPLPKNLATFMDEASDAGVIFFSLGSVLKVSQIPVDKMKALTNAFQRIPQRVIMKSDIPLPNLSQNVLLSSNWLPQTDILKHPKTKVFISHCGLRSSHEAKYAAIPVLALPLFSDQPRNARYMENDGLAIVLHWEIISTDVIVEALDKLVNITSYKERMMRVSNTFRSQKQSSAERAVWWIEYIIKQGKSERMMFPGKRLNFVQYFLIDIILSFIALFFVVLLMLILIYRKVFLKINNYIKKEKCS